MILASKYIFQTSQLPSDLTAQHYSTPLHFAISCSRNYDVCRLLLDHGSDIQNRNKGGGTALHTFWNPSVWNVLRRCGSEVDLATRDEFDRTILHYLAWSSQTTPAALQPYCEDRHRHAFISSIEANDNQGCTPIHLAAQRGNAALTAQLLSFARRPLPPWPRDKAGRTPLHQAAKSRRAPETIAALMAAAAGPQAPLYIHLRDHSGRTALHEALALRNPKAVVALLALEGDGGDAAMQALRTPDHAGVSPLKLLRAWQADVTVNEESAVPKEVENMLRVATLSTSEGLSTRRVNPGQDRSKHLRSDLEKWQVRIYDGLLHYYSLSWSERLLLQGILLLVISFLYTV